jgi:hypothetical protein
LLAANEICCPNKCEERESGKITFGPISLGKAYAEQVSFLRFVFIREIRGPDSCHLSGNISHG